MKFKLFLLATSISFLSYCQNDEYMVWTELSTSGDLVKKTDWSFDICSRFDNQGVATFFPQFGVDYKLTKWLKPSVEYRFLVDRNKYGNYKSAHRINLNAKFSENFDRLGMDLRLRYQYAFKQFGPQTDFNSDFDQAIRIKPGIEYDIKGFFLTPFTSAEFFYNPQIGENGRQFDKLRWGIGAKLDTDGNHGFSFKYQMDKWFHDYSHGLRHVLSFSYEYSF